MRQIGDSPLGNLADVFLTRTCTREMRVQLRESVLCRFGVSQQASPAQHDSAARALGRFARTFPTQIEALNRYRSHGEFAFTVKNVSVGDGGKAVVGNVTQHARVIVSDKSPAYAALKAPGSRPRHDSADAKRHAQA
jgi:hypothetical protein